MRHAVRVEEDSLGPVEIPADRLYGANTSRALGNFPSSAALGAFPDFIRALAIVKKVAAEVNHALGLLNDVRARAIVAACDELIAGQHHDQCVVELLEGSGGTSTNMNVNEVIANRALEIMGQPRGSYAALNPNDHVNLSQSTNDVYPTALKLALHAMSARLAEVLAAMQLTLADKASSFANVLRVGRTCMQSAQPMTLGQAFGGYASAIARARAALEARREVLLEVPLGATAIGTGLGAAPGYRERIADALSRAYGSRVRLSGNFFDGLQNADEIGRFSAELRTCSQIVARIGADLELLASSPDSGLGEITLPRVQAGSSIMPGKVNPVMPMLAQQLAFVVQGHDTTTALAILHGQFEINHFEPAMARALFEACNLMSASYALFNERCLKGVEAREERSYLNLRNSPAIASLFLADIGYAGVTRIVQEAEREGIAFVDVAIREQLMTESEVRLRLTQAASPHARP